MVTVGMSLYAPHLDLSAESGNEPDGDTVDGFSLEDILVTLQLNKRVVYPLASPLRAPLEHANTERFNFTD